MLQLEIVRSWFKMRKRKREKHGPTCFKGRFGSGLEVGVKYEEPGQGRVSSLELRSGLEFQVQSQGSSIRSHVRVESQDKIESRVRSISDLELDSRFRSWLLETWLCWGQVPVQDQILGRGWISSPKSRTWSKARVRVGSQVPDLKSRVKVSPLPMFRVKVRSRVDIKGKAQVSGIGLGRGRASI
ncbi:hypothetical protein HAX54_000731 [Datura stramonium]|uniref:Uncharacterized protein n=1 Tax=Datura stramonium TaxID=4076 RepID=A0ABS8T1G2_DATST|nr:hypothetical protein [Datura stramonium]